MVRITTRACCLRGGHGTTGDRRVLLSRGMAGRAALPVVNALYIGCAIISACGMLTAWLTNRAPRALAGEDRGAAVSFRGRRRLGFAVVARCELRRNRAPRASSPQNGVASRGSARHRVGARSDRHISAIAACPAHRPYARGAGDSHRLARRNPPTVPWPFAARPR